MKRLHDRGERVHGGFGQQPTNQVRHERRGSAPSGPVGRLPWWLALLLAIAAGALFGWISVQVAFFLLTLQLHL
jgi:hypothetical protein